MMIPAAVDDIPPAPIGGASEKGELKALHNVKPNARDSGLANLIRGRYARAEATAAGAQPEGIAHAVQRAAHEVLARPLKDFTLPGGAGCDGRGG